MMQERKIREIIICSIPVDRVKISMKYSKTHSEKERCRIYVPQFMSIGESFVYSDDGNIKRFTSGARPNSILTDKDCNRFKLLPHYRCRRQPVERDLEVRILNWKGRTLLRRKSIEFVVRPVASLL